MSSQPKKVVVSVLGKSVLEGNFSTYTTSNGNTYECDSATSFLPILHEAGGGGVDKELLLIAPHSLLVDELENIRDTEDFKERIASRLSGYRCKNNSANISIIYNNGLRIDDNKNRYPVKIQPVQVRGNIGGYVFNGDPRTAFTATYHALVQIGKESPIEEVIVDTTHGWNHILLLTAYGAHLYVFSRGKKLTYYTSLPTSSFSSGFYSENIPIYKIQKIYDIVRLINILSNINIISQQIDSAEDKINNIILDNAKRINNYEKEIIQKLSHDYVDLIYALSLGMIPYIYCKYHNLYELLKNKRSQYDDLNNKIVQMLDKIINYKINNNNITYDNDIMLHYIIYDYIRYSIEEKLKFKEINIIINKESIILSYFINLLKELYKKEGYLFMLNIYEHEINNIVSCIIKENKKGNLKKCVKNIGRAGGLLVDILEFKVSNNIKDNEDIRDKYLDYLKKNPRRGYNQFKKFYNIIKNDSNFDPSFIRHLIAHVGIVDYVVKNVKVSNVLNDIILVYDTKICNIIDENRKKIMEEVK